MPTSILVRSGRPRTRSGTEDGVMLLEALFGVVLIGLVVATAGGLAIRSILDSAEIDHQTSAVLVANQALEQVRALQVQTDTTGATLLVTGRSSAAVQAQWAAHPTAVTDTDPAWDTVGTTTTPTLPLSTVRTIDGIPYTTDLLIGTCRRPANGSPCVPAAQASASSGLLYRVIAVVSWPGCVSICPVIADTLVDAGRDPTFNSVSDSLPVANPDLACSTSGQKVTFDVTANDTGTLGPTPVTILTAPAHGTLTTVTGSGSMSWTPTSGFVGQDSFTYRVTDTTGHASNTTTVTLRSGMGTC